MSRLLRIVLLASLLSTTALIAACGDDEKIVDCFSCKCDPALCVVERPEDVLNKIESAYNKRRVDSYNDLLDQNFTFFLSTGDVNGGLPVSWNRADEIDVNTKLFDINYPDHPCQRIFMDVRTEDGISWIEIHPESAPSETWYQTTLYYDFRFDISPNTYIPLTGAKAVFTVRDAGKVGNSDHHWQLVEMRDLGSDAIVSASASVVATEPSTWGQVKALYR